MRASKWIPTLLLTLAFGYTRAQTIEQRLQHVVDSVYAANQQMTGIVVHIEVPDRHLSWDYATGYCNKQTLQPLSAGQPVLIASNTKTYISAAILRLVEQHKLTIDQPIEKLLKPDTRQLLTSVGYQLDIITIRQLLSHTSGIQDFSGDTYFDSVSAYPKRQWTRDEQIKLAAAKGGPYAPPADSFRYADMNYLLLSEILENTTGVPYYKAVRKLLLLNKLGLKNTWFVQQEQTPDKLPPFAHQYWSKRSWDSYDLNPSWDLYGGGGQAATAKDMALFYQHLFSGAIIHDKAVLALMYENVPSKTQTNYCLGVRKLNVDGLTGYYHGGFWGTDVIYYPALNATIAIVSLERSQKDLNGLINKEITRLLKFK